MTDEANRWVDRLSLVPHPEGGYYRESYRSAGRIPHAALPSPFDGDRAFCTAIYFLLTADTFSALHTLHQDEVWHHYAGDALTVHVIDPTGVYSALALGKDAGQSPQAVVPAGCLFGATVEPPGSFALVGCTVAPGFEFADFRLARRGELLPRFPHLADLIGRLTR